MDTSAAKLAAPIVALILAISATIFGRHLGSHATSQISGYITAAIAGVLTVVHGPKVKHAVHKIRKPPKRPAGLITMYDAVTPEHIPRTAAAVIAYNDLAFSDVATVKRLFPHAHILTMAATASDTQAEGLDVESGDATPEQAPAWVKRRLDLDAKRPAVYAALSTMPTVWAHLASAGVTRDQVRLIAADWTDHPHIPAGYDACQWFGGVTKPYDITLCLPDFFDA